MDGKNGAGVPDASVLSAAMFAVAEQLSAWKTCAPARLIPLHRYDAPEKRKGSLRGN
jgi:hypothetical protein